MSRRAITSPPLSSPLRYSLWIGAALSILMISVGLASVSSDFQGLYDWGYFLAALLLGVGILGGGWLLLWSETPPRWLGMLLIGAAVLRLAVGTLWFVTLPTMGHGNIAEKDGYIMADAQERDQAAWKLAKSGDPLSRAFLTEKYRKADQYGGLLFLSALVYRYMGGEFHHPLMMVVVTASFSALAILLTWAMARRAWGEKTARLAAWGLALYPEAVLLGSSQMREAFTITFAVAAFYGLVRFGQDRSWVGLVWMLAPVLLNLPLSPTLTALMMGMMFLTTLVMGRKLLGERSLRDPRLWLIIAGVSLVVMLGLWLAGQQFAPRGDFNPVQSLSWWLRKSAEWQAYLSKRASGMVQKVFRGTPAWMHVPLLLTYGVVQPFLPAAMIATSQAPIYYWINLWRAAGWVILLPALLYAPLRAWSKQGAAGFVRGLTLAVWLAILAASYRAGGDQWDNVRYRVGFAGLQIGLAAWAWMEQRRSADPWLRRALVGVIFGLIWFIPWYMDRYLHIPWPVDDVLKTAGLGAVSLTLYLLWEWVRTSPARRE